MRRRACQVPVQVAELSLRSFLLAGVGHLAIQTTEVSNIHFAYSIYGARGGACEFGVRAAARGGGVYRHRGRGHRHRVNGEVSVAPVFRAGPQP